MMVGLVAFIVYFQEAQRRIPVQYSRSVFRSGRMYRQSGQTHIPLRVNSTGMIPLIFALSIVIFPAFVGSAIASSDNSRAGERRGLPADRLRPGERRLLDIRVRHGRGLHVLLHVVVFQQQNLAENLQRQGGFIPGIRPGRPTQEYINRVLIRITWGGAFFLGTVAVAPYIMSQLIGAGGASASRAVPPPSASPPAASSSSSASSSTRCGRSRRSCSCASTKASSARPSATLVHRPARAPRRRQRHAGRDHQGEDRPAARHDRRTVPREHPRRHRARQEGPALRRKRPARARRADDRHAARAHRAAGLRRRLHARRLPAQHGAGRGAGRGARRQTGKQIDKAIYIPVATEELVRRLAGRWSCPQCGAVYHETNQPPKQAGVCDNCGSQLYQREDDKPEVVRTRLEVNLKTWSRSSTTTGGQGKLLEVDGERPVDEITRDILRLLQGEH